MDDLKQKLAVLKKHHFWVITGLIVILVVAGWWVGASTIQSEFNSRKSKIEGDFSTTQNIQQVSNHPNQAVSDGMKNMIRDQGGDVQVAWQARYDQQREILVWPKELGADFISIVDKLQPFEQLKPADREPLNHVLKSRYRNFIEEDLPKLAEIIGATWHPGAKSAASSGSQSGESSSDADPFSGEAAPEDNSFIVNWNASDQNKFAANYNWGGSSVPTTLEILYAQEDLWVLTNLLKVIARVNKDADAQFNAVIKEIEFIDIGSDALGIERVGRVSEVTAQKTVSSSGGANDNPYGEGTGDTSDSSSSSGDSGNPYAGQSNTASADPADRRYVGFSENKYEALTADRLRTAAESPSEEDAFLVVAKRMPVRMRFKMNIMSIPALIAECSNSELPIEVRQVRINGPSGSGGSAGGFGEGDGGEGYTGPMGSGGSGAGGAGAMLSGNDDGSESGGEGGGEVTIETKEFPYDAEVEVYGIMYIYNPVNPERLGLTEENEEAGGATPDQAGG